ncbi:hypothetical protein, partial [Rickettsiella grylli]|uniref:hypothetical protein n=1 Tax=Rickettsiella grylli TaxID=59196 RepID=UPI000B07C507
IAPCSEGNHEDFSMTPLSSRHPLKNMPLNFAVRYPKKGVNSPKRQLEALEKSLLSLLTQLWDFIELDQLFFYSNHQIDLLTTHHFYKKFLNTLVQNTCLKKLILKPFSLSEYIENLVAFLLYAKLDTLHLDITEANPSAWQAFCEVLKQHPTLKSLILGRISDPFAYSALLDLLDNNPQLKITLLEPVDENTLKTYRALQQRLSKLNLEHFKETHLSQSRLFKIALSTLESLKQLQSDPNKTLEKEKQLETRFALLLGDKNPIVTGSEHRVNALQFIYQPYNPLIYDDAAALIQLDIHKMLETRRTVGYILLKKALETHNREAMKTLLNACARWYEFPCHEEEPFLIRVFQENTGLSHFVFDHIWQTVHMDKSSLIRLYIPHRNQTVGYVLLQKVLKTQNIQLLQNLLNAQVNLFEFSENEKESFLVNIFQCQGAVRKRIIEHIKQDSHLITQALESLKGTNYKGLIHIFNDLKNHLDHYNSLLVEREHPSFLISIAYGILTIWRKIVKLQNLAERRNKECAELYLDLAKSLQMIKCDFNENTDATLSAVLIIMQKIKEKSLNAVRGLFNRSYLHDRVVELAERFERILHAMKTESIVNNETFESKRATNSRPIIAI